jgi:lipopolysaccharide/colanic/teichoic acid biosynthesis glycosyltransferase
MNKDILAPSGIPRSYLLSQTTLGRWQLSLFIFQRRLIWKISISYLPIIKRLIDILGSAAGLMVLSPFLIIISLLIKYEDGGPVLFRQLRIGKHGQPFKMFKFRSMFVDAEQRLKDIMHQNEHTEGVTFKIKNDPRLTRVGRFIRKWSLDELPQLINVLSGEMSLVGPRPPIPREVLLYDLAERKRLEVTPGITCFWQVSGRSNIPFSCQVILDLQYIEKQSITLDLKLLLKTIPAVLSGNGAY